MTDGKGRIIDYIRVSLTDRCNLRCVYCMPAQGVEPEPYENLLTLEEITRVCAAAARLGASSSGDRKHFLGKYRDIH